MKKLLLLSSLGLATLLVAPGQAQAADLLIDSFNNGPVDETIKGNASVKTITGSVAGPEVGVNRAYDFTQIEGSTSADRSTLFMDDDADVLDLSNSTLANSTVTISYPGISAPVDGPGNFVFDFIGDLSASTASVDLTINGTTVTRNILGDTSFAPAEFGLPDDFTITEFSFTIRDVTPGFDLVADQLGFVMDDPNPPVVPEHMTILGTGFALASLPALKKAHNKKKA